MYLDGQEGEFEAFLAQNLAFWRENTGSPGDERGRLYVDLAHDNPAYLLTNLFIAKYLQRLRGGRLVGLAQNWKKACPHYDFERVRKLAQSFLVDEIVDLDALAEEEGGRLGSFEAAIQGLQAGDLRKAVLAFDKEADPDVGRVLYDTWLRQERRGTFDTADAGLLECAEMVFRTRSAVSRAMRQNHIIGAVVGHYHYSPYAFMALEAARQGAPVYFQSLLVPVSLRKFRTVADVRRGRAADFVNAYREIFRPSVSLERLELWERRMFDVQRGTREFFRAVTGSTAVTARREYLQANGLDPRLPVVCFYVPALCGAPHSYGDMQFDDYGDWLQQSLEIATETPRVNFLVKPHPLDSVYDTTGLIRQAEKLYGETPNIRFIGADVSPEQMVETCDLVVTVNGTPGYELALRGVPTLAAGPSRYSGLGFSQETTETGDYRTALAHAGERKSEPEEHREAALFSFFELAGAKCQSLFVPRLRAVNTAAFWSEAELNVRSRYPEEDPLFRNLTFMLATDLPFLLNTDLLGIGGPVTRTTDSNGRAAAATAQHVLALAAIYAMEDRAREAEQSAAHLAKELNSARETLAYLLRCGVPLAFGTGQTGNGFLGTGWSTPEGGGVWTDGQQAEIILPWICGPAMLSLECQAFTPEHSPQRAVELYCNEVLLDRRVFDSHEGVQTWRVRLTARGPEVRISLRIAKPAKAEGDGRLLGLSLSRLRIEATL